MLRKISEAYVESDEGFLIKPVGPEGMQYQHNNKVVVLEVVFDQATRKIGVYVTNAVSWESPAGETITDDEKKAMRENVSRAVKLLRGNFEII